MPLEDFLSDHQIWSNMTKARALAPLLDQKLLHNMKHVLFEMRCVIVGTVDDDLDETSVRSLQEIFKPKCGHAQLLVQLSLAIERSTCWWMKSSFLSGSKLWAKSSRRASIATMLSFRPFYLPWRVKRGSIHTKDRQDCVSMTNELTLSACVPALMTLRIHRWSESVFNKLSCCKSRDSKTRFASSCHSGVMSVPVSPIFCGLIANHSLLINSLRWSSSAAWTSPWPAHASSCLDLSNFGANWPVSSSQLWFLGTGLSSTRQIFWRPAMSPARRILAQRIFRRTFETLPLPCLCRYPFPCLCRCLFPYPCWENPSSNITAPSNWFSNSFYCTDCIRMYCKQFMQIFQPRCTP